MKKKLPKVISPGVSGALAAELKSERGKPRTAPPAERMRASAAAVAREKPIKSVAAEETASAPQEKPAPAQDAGTDAARRRRVAENVVKRFSLWSGAAGLIPVPVIDLAVIGGLQLQMLGRISQLYNIPFAENRGKAVLSCLAGSMIPTASVTGVASLLKGAPGLGTAASMITMPALSASATYAIGIAFITHFSSGGTLSDFEPEKYNALIKEKMRDK